MALIKQLFFLLIKTYQYVISPCLGECCRFYPSCSTYTQKAITEHGLIKGLYLASKRLLRCHPWHSGGIDEVPVSTNKRVKI